MEFRHFKDLTKSDINKSYEMIGRIETIKQTSGPTLMILNDGTQNFTFKAFVKPGLRAYPHINIGDSVRVEATINERNGGIEAEVTSMIKLSANDMELFSQKIADINEKKIELENTSFSIKSDMLESQKDRFIQIAKIIRKAIIDSRPILLRHNADCDGYSSAITIERAIISYMNKVKGEDRQLQFQNYKRAPSKAPFYEYEDSVKDISNWLRDKNRLDAKEPLIIITDNGSTEEDILSIRQMKIYNAEIVVVDHHFPGKVENGKVEVDKYIDAHINPYLTGYDSNICAGMLGYELARFIDIENTNSVFIPAMASILDHTEGVEKDQYIDFAQKEGFTKDYLLDLGEIVDMESHYFRFMESREFFDDLFGGNMLVQQKIVDLLKPELIKRYDAVLEVARHYMQKKDFKNFYLISFDGEKGTFRGEYPAIGKATNHIHKNMEEELDKPVITVTYGSNFMTIRASDAIENFSVPEFVNIVMSKMPFANVNGGGHEHAGSVRCVDYALDDVMNMFILYLNEISNKK